MGFGPGPDEEHAFRGGMGSGGRAHLSIDDPENWSTIETGYRAIMGFYPRNVLPEEIMGESPCRGMVIIPHGFGLEHCGKVRGVNVNYLTPATNRDRLAGTPLHKSVPCRVSAV